MLDFLLDNPMILVGLAVLGLNVIAEILGLFSVRLRDTVHGWIPSIRDGVPRAVELFRPLINFLVRKGPPPSVLVLAVLGLTLVGCTPAVRAGVKAGLAGAAATCEELDKSQQDEPSAVKFICEAVEIGDQIGQRFLVRVPKETAPSFARAHAGCPEDGGLAP